MRKWIPPVLLALIVTGCARQETTSVSPEPDSRIARDATGKTIIRHPQTKMSPESQQPIGQSVDASLVEEGSYKFRLVPEIEKEGETHLDLSVYDANDQPVSGAKVVASLTGVYGHHRSIDLMEDKASKHYGGKTTLEEPGDYLVVVQVTVDGKQLNPRFTITRKE